MIRYNRCNIRLREIREEILLIVEELFHLDCANDQRRNTHILSALNDISYSVVLYKLYQTVKYPITSEPVRLFQEKMALYLLLKGLTDEFVEDMFDHEFTDILLEVSATFDICLEVTGFDLWSISKLGQSSLVIERVGDYREVFFFEAMRCGFMPKVKVNNCIDNLQEFCTDVGCFTNALNNLEGY